MANARREFNQENIELWLTHYGYHVPTRPPTHPDELHTRTNKPQSRPNQDLRWLEAVMDADIQRTHLFLVRAMRMLSAGDWEAHQALTAVDRLSEDYERGMKFLLDLAQKEKRLLVMVSPEEAKGRVEENRKKRRIARQVYFQSLDEGAKPGQAIRNAMRESRASRPAVYKWTRQGPKRGKPKP